MKGQASPAISRSPSTSDVITSAARDLPSVTFIPADVSLGAGYAMRNLLSSTGASGRGSLVSLGMTIALLLSSSACREHGRPDPQIRMAISHDREEVAGAETTPAVPNRLEVPPEVLKAYSGIRLRWKDSTKNKDGTVEVPLEGKARIPDSDLEVRADVFLPAFTMSQQAITSSGTEPANPAARITVLEKGQEIFGGWIFTRFPDVHPFQHPRFSLLLEGGVPRKTS